MFFVWGAIGLCAGLLLATVYVDGLRDVLRITKPGAQGWLASAGDEPCPVGGGTGDQGRGKTLAQDE